jgi:hypothetical protein
MRKSKFWFTFTHKSRLSHVLGYNHRFHMMGNLTLRQNQFVLKNLICRKIACLYNWRSGIAGVCGYWYPLSPHPHTHTHTLTPNQRNECNQKLDRNQNNRKNRKHRFFVIIMISSLLSVRIVLFQLSDSYIQT